MTLTINHFAIMSERALLCAQLVGDIDLIKPLVHEAKAPASEIIRLISSVAQVYDLRFESLFEAYSEAVSHKVFCGYNIEECLMQWWGACEDLRCAVQALQEPDFCNEHVDGILIGVSSMFTVRAARFSKLLKGAQPVEAIPVAKNVKKSQEKKKDKVNSKKAKAAYGLFTSGR